MRLHIVSRFRQPENLEVHILRNRTIINNTTLFSHGQISICRKVRGQPVQEVVEIAPDLDALPDFSFYKQLQFHRPQVRLDSISILDRGPRYCSLFRVVMTDLENTVSFAYEGRLIRGLPVTNPPWVLSCYEQLHTSQPSTRNCNFEAQHPTPETRNPTPEPRNPEP